MRGREPSKTFYVFLCSLLGLLVFLAIQRTMVLLYLVYVESSAGWATLASSIDVSLVAAIDYVSLLFALIFGAWYGVWVGRSWYQTIYVEGGRTGLISSVFHYQKNDEEDGRDPARGADAAPQNTWARPAAKMNMRVVPKFQDPPPLKSMAEMTKRIEQEIEQIQYVKPTLPRKRQPAKKSVAPKPAQAKGRVPAKPRKTSAVNKKAGEGKIII